MEQRKKQYEKPVMIDQGRVEVDGLIVREQGLRIDDDAVADDADLVGAEDAGGDDVEGELAKLVDDGVAGVVAG